MAASTVNRRTRYREYTQFLRVSADRLDMSVAPARLEQLQERVSSERNAFLIWVVVWSLIAVASIIPLVMLLTAHFGLPMPAFVVQQSGVLYSQLRVGPEPTNADFVAVGSVAISAASVLIAFVPVFANWGALNDLEHANRILKAVARG